MWLSRGGIGGCGLSFFFLFFFFFVVVVVVVLERW